MSSKNATHQIGQRQVEIIHQNQTQVYVRGSLSEGDWLVEKGTHRLVIGQKVIAQAPAMQGNPNAAHSGEAAVRAN